MTAIRTLVLSSLALAALPAAAQRWHGRDHGGWRGRLPTHRVYRPARPVRVYERNVYRPRIVVGRPYAATEWRRFHPGWRERYYWHGGRYYYDNAYRHPARVDNEWGAIAGLSGGAALVGALDHDPFLAFAGTAGALYSLNRYEQDRRSADAHLRLRASYFSRPYFYRDGVRYDRSLVNAGGGRYYRFRRV